MGSTGKAPLRINKSTAQDHEALRKQFTSEDPRDTAPGVEPWLPERSDGCKMCVLRMITGRIRTEWGMKVTGKRTPKRRMKNKIQTQTEFLETTLNLKSQ